MRIYTRVVMNWDGDVLDTDAYEYTGPVVECKGSSSSTTVDEDYNDRMATISEEQQDWAREYFEMWQEYGKPYEIAQYQADTELLPYETDFTKNAITNATSLLSQESDVMSKYLTESLEGVDVNERMANAVADVAASYADTESTNRRSAARMGVNPNSGRYAGITAASDTEKAAALAGAKTSARIGAETENYERLANASQAGLSSKMLSGISSLSS